MSRRLRFVAANLGYLILGASVAATAAQPGSCAPLVQRALEAVDANCSDLGRNTVCYGFNRVDASFFEPVEESFFSTPADRADLVQLASIQTAPLDELNDQWGVAMMNVQANVPNTLPGQAVTFVLLGDTRVENAVLPESAFLAGDPVRVVISAGGRINVRSGPGTTFNVVANADPGQLFDVDARNEAGDWLRISGPAPYQWINRALLAVQTGESSQLDSLPVAPDAPQSPMQSFYFRTGIGAPQCYEAPDMLVVQGPQEVRVSLTVNGAEVGLGSTVAFQSTEAMLSQLKGEAGLDGALDDADAPDDLVCLVTEMSVLEGDAVANGGELFVSLGHWAKSAACLNADRSPAFTTPFGAPREMTDEELEAFAPLLDVPYPRYALELPSRDDIERSKSSGPDEKPEPTRLPRIQLSRPSSLPTQPGDDSTSPRPTETPVTDPPSKPPAPSCDGFALIGPGGQVDAFNQLFAWTFASNVAGYQLEINGLGIDNTAAQTKFYRVGSETNGINVNLVNDFGRGLTEISWKVQVLIHDAQGNLTTLCETDYQHSKVVYQGG